MVFYGSGEVRLGIEEAWNSCVVLCEELDACLITDDIWSGLMTESFNLGDICITGDGNSLLFELMPLLLNHRVSQAVLCKELGECWQTEDIWYGLMTELFNGGETYITGNDNSFLFEWLSLRLKHRLSRGVIRCLPWLFPFPLWWQLQMPLGSGMMNAIWVCGDVMCLLFYFVYGHQKVRANF